VKGVCDLNNKVRTNRTDRRTKKTDKDERASGGPRRFKQVHDQEKKREKKREKSRRKGVPKNTSKKFCFFWFLGHGKFYPILIIITIFFLFFYFFIFLTQENEGTAA
jgi:hypothetical protein